MKQAVHCFRALISHRAGGGVELARALAQAAHGGQVVLSESAWASVRGLLVAHPGGWGHTHT